MYRDTHLLSCALDEALHICELYLIHASRVIPSRASAECLATEKSSPTEFAGLMSWWSNTDGASISRAVSPCVAAMHMQVISACQLSNGRSAEFAR